MAYIMPDTTIKILKNVPLDPTYDHTIYFANANDQYAYFASKVKGANYTFNTQSYQRVNRGWLKIGCAADNLYDCNYLMFQNSAFGTKWFYAFIKTVEYVNDETTQIEYEIDDIQTWFFDYELEQCFVEREHVSDDTIGKHTVPEQVEIGSYVFDTSLTDYGHCSLFDNNGSNWSIIVVATVTLNQQQEIVPATGRMYGKMYTGLAFNRFTSASAANTFIDNVTQNLAYGEDAILAIFMIPDQFLVGDGTTNWRGYGLSKAYSWTITRGNTQSQPKNNKLYTYPYNMLVVTTSEGNNAEYKYEYFSGTTASIGVRGSISASPQAQLVPFSYKGLAYAYNEQLLINSFPFCTYITDAYKAWLALNSTKQTTSAISAGMGLGADAIKIAQSVGTVGAAKSAALIGEAVQSNFDRISGIIVPQIVAETMPPHAKGQSSNVLDMQMGTFGYWFYNAHVRNEYAIMIDDYFSMFGYACHEVKVPNRNVRTYWTYTKTVGCVIKGSIPADSARRICSIYDNGITFWRYSANIDNNIGNYSLNNAISV